MAANIRVNKVMLARETYSTAVQALLHTRPVPTVIPTYTGQNFQIDGVAFNIEQAVDNNNRQPATGNEVSSVVRVSYGQHSFLITGDLEAHGEEELLAKKVNPCTVLKVGHHGARTSSTPAFLQAVSPKFAVISAGYNNRFGHPHPETLKRLADIHTIVYRTDQQGAIVFKSDGKHMEIETYIK